MPSLGEQFRAAREARGVTLSEAAERIHIRSIYLQAIEEEDWPSIGAAVYVRGFLRTYARFLGLDPEGAVAHFNELTGIQPPSSTTVFETAAESPRYGRSGPSIWVWLAGVVAVALLAIVGYSFWQLESSGQRAVVAMPSPSAAPAATALPGAGASEPSAVPAKASPLPSPSPQPRTSGVETVTLTWTAPSWVRVVVDGKEISEGTFPANTVRTYEGASIKLRVGNAGGINIKENGRDLGTLGQTGDVVDRTFASDAKTLHT